MIMRKIIFAIVISIVSALAGWSANPVAAMIDRIDPGASKNFKLEIKPSKTNYFELDQQGNKVVIRANNYINQAVGLNWYLKHHAGIHLCWNGMTAELPNPLPKVEQKERHENPYEHCYDFNYCTFSYTMPFWDWARWEQELDWMALHGVNLPLAAVGEECVYRNMLIRLGYTKDEVSEFIAGPAFLAWWAMNNLEGWGGPNPDSWYERQEDLQKKILARMKEWGMEPVLPGFAGMMPHNADEKLGLNITKNMKPWNGFVRPAFLMSTDSSYADIAKVYYEELEKLYGKAKYYSMDPFHENGGENLDFVGAGQAVMEAMKRNNPKSVWVIQAWSGNPNEEMIDNLNQGDLLVLDLFSECKPMWGIPSKAQRKNGFGKHEWLMCMLENFGGNVGLHGRMDQLLANYKATKTNPLAAHLKGIGFTMEGSENNPVMYELMSELPWRSDNVNKEEWLKEYTSARYGRCDDRVVEAWHILGNSIYNCPEGNIQQGTTESIFCCRPNLDNKQASSWSKMDMYYDPADTRRAAELMNEVAENYRGNNNFEYDLVDITRQAIADEARLAYQHAIADYKAFHKEGFEKNSQRFIDLLLMQDELLGSRPEFGVGRWIEFARNAGTTPEEKDQYEWNARVQITTWGARENADKGKLHDYAHKEWNGLLRDFYLPRWQAFFATLADVLNGKQELETIDYYSIEEPWTLQHNEYPSTAVGDPIELSRKAINLINAN